MPITSRKLKQLDGREIMELWVEMGSLGRVLRYYETTGKINEDTGEPFTQSALWRSASTFMIEQPDDARVLYEKAGASFSDSEWEQLVLRRAMQIYRNSRKTFLMWIIRKEWPRKYEPLYRDEYNVTEADYNYFAQTVRRMPKREGSQLQHLGDVPE